MSEEMEKLGDGLRTDGGCGAICIFDRYDIKFGMRKEEVSKLIEYDSKGEVTGEALTEICARNVDFLFDHNERLWQVKAWYLIKGVAEAEALLERMSNDFRFQTPSVRVAFDLTKTGEDTETLEVRYTEINIKRNYIHHMLAVAESMKVEEEKRAQLIKDKEDEDYIPTGPLVF